MKTKNIAASLTKLMLMFLLVVVLVQLAQAEKSNTDHFQRRFPLTNVYDKWVDNRGNGDSRIYGVRNFRVVLRGVVYRGGANNKFHATEPRDNMNPLPHDGLVNLCEEGFEHSIYLYPTNYESAPNRVNCRTRYGVAANRLDYEQESVLTDNSAALRILEFLHAKLQQPDPRPIYLHCWNGWHASGYISALALRQFCGYSVDQAISYWNRNTDGHNQGEPGYDRIRRKIRDYQLRADLLLSFEQRQKYCY